MADSLIPNDPANPTRLSPRQPSGRGNYLGYYVEARTTSREPREHRGRILTRDWQRVTTVEVADGSPVPAGAISVPSAKWHPHATDHGWMTAEAAVAFATAFHLTTGTTLCDQLLGGYEIQTRLVKVRVQWEYTAVEEGVTEPFCLSDQVRGGIPVTPRGEDPGDE